MMLARKESKEIKDALARCEGPVDASLSVFRVAGESAEVVTTWEAFVDSLMTEPLLMWKQKIHSNNMGVHPWNRGGLGVNLRQALSDALTHCTAGYSYRKACDGAFGVAADHNAKSDDSCVTQGMPPIETLWGLSFGASHQNTFLRAVLAKMEVVGLPKLAPGGRLDPKAMLQKWPSLKTALEQGLEWTMIHPAVVERWPDIVRIGQKALNHRGTSEVSEIEGLLTIYEGYMVAKMSGMSEDDAWLASLTEAQRCDPFWASWGHSLLALCKSVSQEQVAEVSDMKKVLVKTPEGAPNTWGNLGDAYLHKVAGLRWPGILQLQRIKAAALTANILSPLTKIVDGKCSLLKASDLSALTDKKNKKDVALAEEMMDQARVAADNVNLSGPFRFGALAKHDARVLLHLLKKGKQGFEEKQYSDIYDAAHQFTLECAAVDKEVSLWMPKRPPLKKITGKQKPGEAVAQQEPAATSTEMDEEANDEAPSLQTMGDLKNANVQMEKRGFKVGVVIKKKKDADREALFEITAVKDNAFTVGPALKMNAMASLTNKLEFDVPFDDITELWSTTGREPQRAALFGQHFEVWGIDVAKAAITVALERAWDQHEAMQGDEDLELFLNPRAVRTKRAFARHELQLVPATCRIVHHAYDEEKITYPTLNLGVVKQGLPSFALQSHFQIAAAAADDKEKTKNFAVAFWAVTACKTADDKRINMELVTQEFNDVGLGETPVKIPIMTNKRAIKAGTVLAISGAQKAGLATRVEPAANADPAAKRAKTS
jgi:hypothetical protein